MPRLFTENLRIAGGMVVAPWLYLAGRAIKSRALIQSATRKDHLYMRAHEVLVRHKPKSANSFFGQLLMAAELVAGTNNGAEFVIRKYLAPSESQILQDIFAILVAAERPNGFFVEVGVGNGKTISNTYILEKELGWTGILVEPNRTFHDPIVSCRTASLDRRAAVSHGNPVLRFEEAVDFGEFSRLVGAGKLATGETWRELPPGEHRSYDVETATLTEILDEHGAPGIIDYLSLDTEGTEPDIIAGIDFSKYRFQAITIESDYRPGVREGLVKKLAPFGYRQIFGDFSGYDTWFIHSSVDSPYIP